MERWADAVADTIRAERAAAQLTQAELAARAGMPRITYIRYETGERKPNVAQVAAIAEALRMMPSTFLARAQARVDQDR